MSDSSDFITESEGEQMTSSSDEQVPQEGEPKKDPEGTRFVRELEFVQCLANPRYLHIMLVQRNYFGDPNFVNYLKYLMYWTRPEYIKYIRYPQAIHFLRLLQDQEFRAQLADISFIQSLEAEQHNYHWHYRRNRLDISLPEVEVKTPPEWPPQ